MPFFYIQLPSRGIVIKSGMAGRTWSTFVSRSAELRELCRASLECASRRYRYSRRLGAAKSVEEIKMRLFIHWNSLAPISSKFHRSILNLTIKSSACHQQLLIRRLLYRLGELGDDRLKVVTRHFVITYIAYESTTLTWNASSALDFR